MKITAFCLGMMNMAGQQRPNVPQQHQQQQRGPGMSALEAQLNKPPNQMPGASGNPGMKPNQRDIWQGDLKWKNPKSDSSQEPAMHSLLCRITSQVKQQNNEPEVRSENWPQHLVMQLIPKSLVSTIGKKIFLMITHYDIRVKSHEID